jgi:hypothetical protein
MAPECARLNKILSKEEQSSISSIQLENGAYTTEKGTMEELLRVHFPGSEIIPEPSGGWDGLELEFPDRKGSREDWAVSRRVINYYKLKWAVFSFQPYKSPGMDGIMPIMLQQGFELLGGKLLMLLRASLALGYIPMSWRHTRVVFIPKPGKPLTQAKSLRPISLMSFVLKTLEKLLDRHIRGGVLVEKPLHQNQFAYRAGMSTDTALYQVVHKLEKCLEHKEIALGAFLDIEGAFDNTSFNAIITAARERGLEETCCRWIESMLMSRLVHTSLMGSSLTAKVVGGCPQGGVLSPLLWNLVVDRLLVDTNDLGFSTYGYADDIVIIVQGKFAHTVSEVMQQALNVVVKWAEREGLTISPLKTAIVPFTKRKKTEGLRPLSIHGKELEMLDKVKYSYTKQ